MEHLHGPQTQVVEGAYAIKVSMRFVRRKDSPFILFCGWCTDHLCHVFSQLTNSLEVFHHPHQRNLGAAVLTIYGSASRLTKVIGWAFLYAREKWRGFYHLLYDSDLLGTLCWMGVRSSTGATEN